jgi:sulfatase maturation enzyme AslB (radical SAM superfamily)
MEVYDEEIFNKVIKNLMNGWKIDEDTASSIVANEMQELMDMTMFITADGMVYPCNDRLDLEKELLEYTQEAAMGDIQYIFIDGEQYDVSVCFIFKKREI